MYRFYCNPLSSVAFIVLCFCVWSLFHNIEVFFNFGGVFAFIVQCLFLKVPMFVIVVFPDHTLVCVSTGKKDNIYILSTHCVRANNAFTKRFICQA